jgi:hypothetical protein
MRFLESWSPGTAAVVRLSALQNDEKYHKIDVISSAFLGFGIYGWRGTVFG